jgi:L-lysine exporter family protein LysE/ArgO
MTPPDLSPHYLSPSYLTPFIEGFLLSSGLVMVIGPQNTFVLRHSLSRQHLHVMVLLCVLLDTTLISLGVFGVGELIRGLEFFTKILTLAGTLFLVCYGFRSFRAAFNIRSVTVEAQHVPSRRTLVFTLLGVTLLNPSAYLDALVVIGGSASRYAVELRPMFTLGAVLASLLWFSGLSYGASLLTPWFKHPVILRGLEFLSGSVMWFMAYRLWQHSL